MEPEITKEVEAAERLLKPQPKDVPPQLLLALEKDGRSLARGYEAARTLSEGILQSLRDHRDSYKVKGSVKRKPERNIRLGILFVFPVPSIFNRVDLSFRRQ